MNADIIRERLQWLADQNHGAITAEMVVEDARPEGSPLHKFFEWDEGKAAELHWISTARRLIRSVEVVVTTSRTVVAAPYYVRDPRVDAGDQGMVSIARVRTDDDMARSVLTEEVKRALSALRRAHAVAAVLDLQDEVESMMDSLTNIAARVSEAVEGVQQQA